MGDDANLIGRFAHGDGTAGGTGWHAVAIAIHPYQTGRGDAHHVFDIAIEAGRDRSQQRLLVGKAVSNAALALRGMATLGQFLATGRQPVIEFNERRKACQGCEQPFAHIADLILDLAFLPTRGRRTGDGLEQIVIGQAEEAPIELARLTRKDYLHNSLEIVVDQASG